MFGAYRKGGAHMTRSLLDMYRESGGSETIWDQLRALGDLEEGTPAWAEAYSVALETMRRARQNVERIVAFLRDQGYRFGDKPAPFGDAEPPWLPPAPDVTEQLQRLTALVGPIPLSLRAWWEVVGFVSLEGTFYDDWEETDGLPMTDPL